MPVFKQSDSNTIENNSHPPPVPTAPLPSLAEPRVERVQSPVAEQPAAAPANSSEYHLLSDDLCFPLLFSQVKKESAQD